MLCIRVEKHYSITICRVFARCFSEHDGRHHYFTIKSHVNSQNTELRAGSDLSINRNETVRLVISKTEFPNFHILVFVSYLYIPRNGLPDK